MQNQIRFWLSEYRAGGYVRLSIVDRRSGGAVGTIECFARPGVDPKYGKVGLLRIDLAPACERERSIGEILGLVQRNFYGAFRVDSLITKAIPAATERIKALTAAGYQALEAGAVVPYGDYYIQTAGAGQAS
jgi:hypothetical protein